MHRSLPEALFDLHMWDQLSPGECEELTRLVATSLPSAFQFVRVETYQIGAQRHHIALFQWHEAPQRPPCLFALIPGGTVTLGYDRTQQLTPTEDLVREWQEYSLEHHGEMVTMDGDHIRDIVPTNYDAWYAYLDRTLLPLRTATLQPLLLEVRAQVAGLLMPRPVMTYHRYKLEYSTQDKYVKHFKRWGVAPIPQRHVAAFLKKQGFRLPTNDEWEYACAAGSSTLFHWGNGLFDPCGEKDINEFVSCPTHNAFGLVIAHNADRWEYCADPTLIRGGDGGNASGRLAASLPLASAYALQLNNKQINNGVYAPEIRRVYDLIRPS